MPDFIFEGEVESLSEKHTQFISGVLQERGFSNGKVFVEAVGKADDNYVANVKRFIIEKDGVTFKMIAKIAPSNPALRNTMPTGVLFKNEHTMYTQVLPKFTELEKGADIPPNERLRYAQCYGTFLEEPYEIILLEDLKISDYTILDKQKTLTDECVKMILKNFAYLHSSSYVLKHQEPETYESFKTQLYNSWVLMNEIEEMKAYFNLIEDGAVAILDNNKYKKVTKGAMTRLPGLLLKNWKYDNVSKYSVIQQGDSWTNNIMFRLQDGKPTECCMIDYQLSCHNSPVADIHYMIFNCTDYEMRSKHYNEWIDYYHSELDKRLSNFGLKISMVLPRDQLDADLRRQAKIFFGFGLMLASTIMRETHEAANMKAAMENDFTMEDMLNMGNLAIMESSSKIRFKEKIEGLIATCLELGYL